LATPLAQASADGAHLEAITGSFPVAVNAPEGVAEGGIHDDAVAAAALHGEFGFKGPAALAGGGAEEVEEGLADGGFPGDVVLVELGEGGVVSLDELVSWLEAGLLDARHGGVLQEGERERQRNDKARRTEGTERPVWADLVIAHRERGHPRRGHASANHRSARGTMPA